MNLLPPPLPLSIAEVNRMSLDMADSMCKLANAVALLGIEGDADEQMAIIKAEQDKVLNQIRQTFGLK